MKATKAGYTVGKALEAWQPCIENLGIENSLKIVNCKLKIDKIEAFVSLGYYVGELNRDGDLRTLSVDTLKAHEIESHSIKIDDIDVKQTLFDLRHKIDNLTKRLEALEQKITPYLQIDKYHIV